MHAKHNKYILLQEIQPVKYILKYILLQEMHPSTPTQQTQSLNYPGVNITFSTHNMTSSSNILFSSKEARPGYAQNDDLGRMEEFDSEDSSLSLVDEEGEAGSKVNNHAGI